MNREPNSDIQRKDHAGKSSFVPRIISWNTTFKCNLQCGHCYIDARENEKSTELTTEEGKDLINQIAEVSKPVLVLSGGEPLLREDIFELAKYATNKGLRVAMGTNGTLIKDETTKKMLFAGIRKVAISLDSSEPSIHDELRREPDSWEKAIEGIRSCIRSGVTVQVNTTITQQNYGDIHNIVSLAEGLGVKDFHVFFLVPTGRGKSITDISPPMYETMVRTILEKYSNRDLVVKPTCAPQFMRIARQIGLETSHWSRGCIAGLSYCRIYPSGEVTPCPYLPITLGSIKNTPFKEIWYTSEILGKLRNFDNLKGKCHICQYQGECGGCRARAYGLSSSFIDVCGCLHEPRSLDGDFLAEEPWCVYQPSFSETESIRNDSNVKSDSSGRTLGVN